MAAEIAGECKKLVKESATNRPTAAARLIHEHRQSGSSDPNLHYLLQKRISSLDEIIKCLKIMVVKSDEDDVEGDIVDEWKQVALVVDRTMFWVFFLITFIATIVVLGILPAMKGEIDI